MTTSGFESMGTWQLLHLRHGRAHTFRYPALEIGMNGMVLQAQNVPTGLRLPWSALDFLLLE